MLLFAPEIMGKYGVCLYCGKELIGRKNKKYCNSVCNGAFHKRKRREEFKNGDEKRKIIDKYFGGGCCICGYNKSTNALEFHHLYQEEKKFGISSNAIIDRGLDACLEELKKCICVCSNCHREIHAGIIDPIELGLGLNNGNNENSGSS